MDCPPRRDVTLSRVTDAQLLDRIAQSVREIAIDALRKLQDVTLEARPTMFANSLGPAPQFELYDCEAHSILTSLPLFSTHCGKVLSAAKLAQLCVDHNLDLLGRES